MKIKTISVASTLMMICALAMAQKADKKWTDWSKKDAQKILEDSPWAKTQTETDTSQQMYSPTTPAGTGPTSEQRGINTERSVVGATNQATNVTFHVRFFSARPIRQALARMIELNQAGMNPDATAKLHNFAELKAGDSIIITVTYQGTDQRYTNEAMQALNSAVTATLKNNTYLQRQDNQQLFLEEYVPPGRDGFGARFIFLRMPEGKPFIDANSKEIRFFTQLPNGQKIDRRFKVADMMYQGELEY